jgi:formate/nitrite transporter FocA (FNT family)
MDLSTLVASLLCVALLAANLTAMLLAWRSHSFTRAQLLAQTMIIWLVPAVGAILVGLFTYSQRLPSRSGRESGGTNQEAFAGELFKGVHPIHNREP